MSFGPWFPLSPTGIEQHAPEGPAAVQIKRESGLLPYPSGKSAMVFYFYAEQSAFEAIQSVFHDELDRQGARGQGPLRFRVWEGLPAQASLELLFAEFVERFGAPPLFHGTPSSEDDADDENGSRVVLNSPSRALGSATDESADNSPSISPQVSDKESE